MRCPFCGGRFSAEKAWCLRCKFTAEYVCDFEFTYGTTPILALLHFFTVRMAEGSDVRMVALAKRLGFKT